MGLKIGRILTKSGELTGMHAIKTIVLLINIAFKNADVEVSKHIDRGLRDESEYHGVYMLKTLVGGKLNIKDV